MTTVTEDAYEMLDRCRNMTHQSGAYMETSATGRHIMVSSQVEQVGVSWHVRLLNPDMSPIMSLHAKGVVSLAVHLQTVIRHDSILPYRRDF